MCWDVLKTRKDTMNFQHVKIFVENIIELPVIVVLGNNFNVYL
jgi:hypothetical protein